MSPPAASTHQGPNDYFTGDHRRCDDIWAEVEGAAERNDSGEALAAWQRFETALRRHLAMEEEVLFSAIEEATGMTGGGPTFVMRSEHEQMRGLLSQMSQAAESGDFDAVVDHGDTLLMLIQQHNAKEEGILYPLADRAIGPTWANLAQSLDNY